MARRVTWAELEAVPDNETERAGETSNGTALEELSDPYDLPGALLAELKHLNIPFAVGTIDYSTPCTMSGSERCYLFHSLSTWNELLSELCLELRQHPKNSMLLSLVDISDSFYVTSSEEVLLQGTVLVYCLLKRHRCVTTIDVNGEVLSTYAGIVFLGLRGGRHIKKVKIVCSRSMLGVFLDSLPLLASVEELELRPPMINSEQFVQSLSMFLRSTITLRSLDISSDLSVRDAGMLLPAIIESRSIKELSLDGSVLEDTIQLEMFREHLVTNTLLTSLNVMGCCMQDNVVGALLSCLQQNRTLMHVVMRGVSFNDESARTITKIIERNESLRTFNMQAMALHRLGEGHILFSRWLHSLENNTTLEEFTLPISAWNEEKWRGFFGSLEAKIHWKKLTIEFSSESYRFVRLLQRMLAECEARQKICFKLVNGLDHTPQKVSWQCYGLFTNGNEGTCLEILQHLPTAFHVTSAQLVVATGLLHTTAVSVISSFLRMTQALKKLHIRTFAFDAGAFNVDEFWSDIVESMSGHATLVEVSLRCEEIDQCSLEALAQVVKTGRIHTVHMNTEPLAGYNAFVLALAAGVDQNYNLLSVSLLGGVEGDVAKEWLQIRQTARRNSDLVMPAAEFACGIRIDRYGAQALERMARHSAVLERVGELTSVNDADAGILIRRALQTFDGLHAFMRLARVVREWVECRPCEDGRPQLDTLGDECWRVIRRYLILEDIKESFQRPECA